MTVSAFTIISFHFQLEEFRRKKTQGKPTKAAVLTSQLPATSGDGLADTVPVESVSNVSVSDGYNVSVSVSDPTTMMIDHQTRSDDSDTFKSAELSLSNRAHSEVDITNDFEYHVQNGINDVKSDSQSFGISGLANGYDNTWAEKGNESTSVVSDMVTTSLQNALNSFQAAPTVDDQLRQSDVFSAVESYSDGHKSAEKHRKSSSLYLGSSTTYLAENPENGFRSEPTTQTYFDVNAGKSSF